MEERECSKSENGTESLKMVKETSVIIIALVDPAHQGQLWMQHE